MRHSPTNASVVQMLSSALVECSQSCDLADSQQRTEKASDGDRSTDDVLKGTSVMFDMYKHSFVVEVLRVVQPLQGVRGDCVCAVCIDPLPQRC